MPAPIVDGFISKPCSRSVDDTLNRLQGILRSKGITIFAVIDHSGEAEGAGLRMRPTKLVIFGSPNAGTPLMQEAPSAAIDLPLKLLIWEDSSASVWISYNAPAYLQARHGFSTNLVPNIAAVEQLAAAAAA